MIRMLSIRILSVALLALLLSGCRVVTSTHLVGESPASLIAEEWEGTWLHREGIVVIKVLDAEKGLIRFSNPKDSESEFVDLQIRESGQEMLTFWNGRENQEEPYTWGLAMNLEGQIALWSPAPEKFKPLVKAGRLPGMIEEDENGKRSGDIRLGQLTSEHIELIMSEREGVLFNWAMPMVFLRMPDDSDK